MVLSLFVDLQALPVSAKLGLGVVSLVLVIASIVAVRAASKVPLPGMFRVSPTGDAPMAIRELGGAQLTKENQSDFERTFLGGGVALYSATQARAGEGAVAMGGKGDVKEPSDTVKQVGLEAFAGSLNDGAFKECGVQDEIKERLDTGTQKQAAWSALWALLMKNVSVNAALRLLQAAELKPKDLQFLQPRFVVLVGRAGAVLDPERPDRPVVRMATYGFIGGPVLGDRPDRKYTPCSLRILTDDLLARAIAEGTNVHSRPVTTEALHAQPIKISYRCEANDSCFSSRQLLERDLPTLSQAVEAGEWDRA